MVTHYYIAQGWKHGIGDDKPYTRGFASTHSTVEEFSKWFKLRHKQEDFSAKEVDEKTWLENYSITKK